MIAMPIRGKQYEKLRRRGWARSGEKEINHGAHIAYSHCRIQAWVAVNQQQDGDNEIFPQLPEAPMLAQ